MDRPDLVELVQEIGKICRAISEAEHIPPGERHIADTIRLADETIGRLKRERAILIEWYQAACRSNVGECPSAKEVETWLSEEVG